MRKIVDIKHRLWMIVITAVSSSLLWSLAVPTVARADCPGCICTLKITADGNVVSTLANKPVGFTTVVLVPPSEDVSLPILCDSLGSLALAVANQADQAVAVNLEIFSNEGQPICTKQPFSLPVNGGRGVTFSDCQ